MDPSRQEPRTAHPGGNAETRIAVIDLGSNTARLVVFAARPGYCFRLEDEIREVVRLREGLFFEEFWRHLDYPVMPDVRRFSVLNAARVYHTRRTHASLTAPVG